MKYTVIVGGNPYTVVADKYERERVSDVVRFTDDNGALVAEFKATRIQGVILQDNNVSEECSCSVCKQAV